MSYSWIRNSIEPEVNSILSPGDIPTCSLNIDWIYGWNCKKNRNILHYLASGEFVYPAACIIVIYNPLSNSQRYFNYHDEIVSTVAIHPGGRIVASAQDGNIPKILIWDSDKLEILTCIKGYQYVGIISLGFSQNGNFLASIGKEYPHSLVVYNWPSKNGRKYFSTTFSYRIYGLCWKGNDSFATCGENGIYIWVKEGNNFICNSSFVGYLSKIKDHTVISVTPDKKYYISGTLSGELIVWEYRNIKEKIEAHEGPVLGITTFGSGFITIGKDDKIKIWGYSKGGKAIPGNIYDLHAIGNFSMISNVSIDPSTSRILLGTYNGSILEVSFIDGKNLHQNALLSSHFEGNLNVLELSKTNQHEFISGGEDGMIYVYDFMTHKILRHCKVNGPINCLSLSPNSKYLLIGFGLKDNKYHHRTGTVEVLEYSTFKVLKDVKDSAKAINCVKWGDNTIFSAGSLDHSVYLYEIKVEESKANVKQMGRCRLLTGIALSIDYSDDLSTIRINTSDKNLFYFDVKECMKIADNNFLSSLKWLSKDFLYHFNLKGIYECGLYNTNEVKCLCIDEEHNCCAFGTKYGELRVTNYPVNKEDIGMAYYGHYNGISSIKFHQKSNYLISSGLNDCCIIEWKILLCPKQNILPKEIDLTDVIQDDLNSGRGMDRSLDYIMANNYDSTMKYKLNKLGDNRIDEIPIYPWMNSISPPTLALYNNPSIPVESLELDWIYGYNNEGMKNNIFLSHKNELIYPAASVIIILNVEKWTQRFYTNHNDYIIALSVNNSKTMAISSQIGKNPKICIWNIETLDTIREISRYNKSPIRQIKFSLNDLSFAVVEMDKYNTLSVYIYIILDIILKIV